MKSLESWNRDLLSCGALLWTTKFTRTLPFGALPKKNKIGKTSHGSTRILYTVLRVCQKFLGRSSSMQSQPTVLLPARTSAIKLDQSTRPSVGARGKWHRGKFKYFCLAGSSSALNAAIAGINKRRATRVKRSQAASVQIHFWPQGGLASALPRPSTALGYTIRFTIVIESR